MGWKYFWRITVSTLDTIDEVFLDNLFNYVHHDISLDHFNAIKYSWNPTSKGLQPDMCKSPFHTHKLFLTMIISFKVTLDKSQSTFSQPFFKCLGTKTGLDVTMSTWAPCNNICINNKMRERSGFKCQSLSIRRTISLDKTWLIDYFTYCSFLSGTKFIYFWHEKESCFFCFWNWHRMFQ